MCQAAGKANVTHAAPLTQNFRNSVRYASVYSVTVCRKMTNLFKGLSLSKKTTYPVGSELPLLV
ncbi:tight adherence protein F [Actinobacillus equuli]|nr:tight adherence protein F [Actinobacillus equuli]